MHKIIATSVLVIFIVLSAILAWLVKTHQRVFDLSYTSLDACHNELNRHLVSERR